MGLLSKAEGRNEPVEIAAANITPQIEEGLETYLEQYQKMNPVVGGLIINIPEDYQSQKDTDGIKKISVMVSHFALVEELPSNLCLIVFPDSLDRDLIAHRLKKNLNTEAPLIFSAKSTAEVLQKIQPFR